MSQHNFETIDQLLETLTQLVANVSFGVWSATIKCGESYNLLTFNSTRHECYVLAAERIQTFLTIIKNIISIISFT